MSDFEYVGDDEWGVPYNHLTCSVCQTLAVLPVRLQHCNVNEDCGTVTCLDCYRNWVRSTKDDTTLTCPRCRRPCPKLTEPNATPDRLLVRLVEACNVRWDAGCRCHLESRCIHCQLVAKVEDMMIHRRSCPHRRPGCRPTSPVTASVCFSCGQRTIPVASPVRARRNASADVNGETYWGRICTQRFHRKWSATSPSGCTAPWTAGRSTSISTASIPSCGICRNS